MPRYSRRGSERTPVVRSRSRGRTRLNTSIRAAGCFAAAGVAVALLAATASARTVVEAETMSLRSGPPHGQPVPDALASGGATLRMLSTNSAVADVATGAESVLKVRARGDSCQGAPALAVAIDGQGVLAAAVATTGYADYVATVALQPGSHRVEVSFTNDFLGGCDRNLYIDAVTFDSDGAQPSPGSTWWRSSFENGAPTPTEWSVWFPANLYGEWGPDRSNAIVAPESFGIPRSADGSAHVARLYHAAADPAIHHKLYKIWMAESWPQGTEPIDARWNRSPPDVSARYLVDLYIPSPPAPDSAALLAQFKESYRDVTGAFHSVPSWWFHLLGDRGRYWFNFTAWGYHHNSADIPATPYLNRWFTVELRLFQHDRVELYLDGVLKDVGRHQEWPVGRTFSPGGPGEQPGGSTTVGGELGWIFGAGNYAHTGKESLVYVDNARLLPLP